MAIINPVQFTSKKNKLITIRNCEDQDLSQLHTFFTKIAQESTHTYMTIEHPFPPLDKINKRWDDIKRSERGLILGAFNNETIIGQLALFQDRPDHPWAKHVAHFGMYMLKDYWGEGIGRELLKVVDAHVIKASITRVEATVRSTNDRGITLYLKSGYKIEGHRKHAAFINGAYQDEYYIGKIYG